MSAAIRQGLEQSELLLTCEPAEYASVGYHTRATVEASAVLELACIFKDAGYYLEMLTCEDRRDPEGVMRLVYAFNRLGQVDRFLVTSDLAEGQPSRTISEVFPAADWYEREVFDMYGVGFNEHPNLTRILLPEDADFHALLKDYGRPEDAVS